VKRICRYLPILSLPLLCVPFASAQSSVDFMLGFGTAHDSANGGGIENANSINAFATCAPGSTDIYCQSNPSLGGFFLGFGGDVMLWKRFGIGATATVQPSRSNYGRPPPRWLPCSAQRRPIKTSWYTGKHSTTSTPYSGR